MKTRQVAKILFNGIEYKILFNDADDNNHYHVYKKWSEYVPDAGRRDHRKLIGKERSINDALTVVASEMNNREMVLIARDKLW